MTAEPATRPTIRTMPGRLGPGRMGASMPVDAPYYQAAPFYFRDAQAMTIAYETDAEAAAALLPEGLDLPLPAMARLMFVRYPFSTFGPYNEAILGVECLWQGEPRFYIAHIAVTEVPPLVAGREVWGYPKKMAHIEIAREAEFLTGTLERPLGVRLITAAVRLERPLPVGVAAGGGGKPFAACHPFGRARRSTFAGRTDRGHQHGDGDARSMGRDGDAELRYCLGPGPMALPPGEASGGGRLLAVRLYVAERAGAETLLTATCASPWGGRHPSSS